MHTYNKRELYNHKKRIDHLTYLIGVISSGMCSPMHRNLYIRIIEEYPEDIPTKEQLTKIISDICLKTYQTARKSLLKQIDETEDLDYKITLQDRLKFMDDSQMLLSTITEDSSDDYAKQVCDNVFFMMRELEERNNL